ncbi:hypothetical protein D1AOALGA4SA_11141 [Olavius algarvensis Delta 1 endosymbiont]|nr:hypothetical protein D1AOALGA4SA_11141 [Olavius algarvensis Delta 1 endosymbiont]
MRPLPQGILSRNLLHLLAVIRLLPSTLGDLAAFPPPVDAKSLEI